MHPILILLVGMAVVISLIVVFRLNAFLALITAAILVSMLSPGEIASRITRVADAFGSMAGSIGIIIAAAAIIGNAMKESGAADRIVLSFLSFLGEERAAEALAMGGFILAVPVFFDTVFFLMVPLAKSAYERTRRSYLRYVLAIPAGGVATHVLVPPTPGALAAAVALGVDLGVMIGVGAVIAFVAAASGLAFAYWADRHFPPPESLRLQTNEVGSPTPGTKRPEELPGLLPSIAPILLPVLLITANTVASTLAQTHPGSLFWASVAPWAAVCGDPNVALLVSAALAMAVYHRSRRPTLTGSATLVEESLMSAGVIILITAAGGAFGAMLRTAGVGEVIQQLFAGGAGTSGVLVLLMAFAVASLLKVAQGSSTVAMITTAGMLAALLSGPVALPFHRVYIATAVASGAMVGVWMNDSGFWVFSRMSGLSEVEALKTYTPMLAVEGCVAMVATIVLSTVLPLH